MPKWDGYDPRRQFFVKSRCETADDFALCAKGMLKDKQDNVAEIAANGVLALINVTCTLDRQLKTQADTFQNEGSFTERLYRNRVASRKETRKVDGVDKCTLVDLSGQSGLKLCPLGST